MFPISVPCWTGLGVSVNTMSHCKLLMVYTEQDKQLTASFYYTLVCFVPETLPSYPPHCVPLPLPFHSPPPSHAPSCPSFPSPSLSLSPSPPPPITQAWNALASAYQDVFEATFKMALFYSLYTWTLHKLFSMEAAILPAGGVSHCALEACDYISSAKEI